MGATVTTGKRAHAFLSNEGVPIFILEEETYEKNVTPHRPRFNVVAFGTYDDVMRHVFRYASATEGGMLQARSGWIGSEGYIKGWRSAIANADLDRNHFRPESVGLFIGTSWLAPIEKGAEASGQWSSESKAIKILRDAHFDWIADDLLAGKTIPMHMKDDLNVLLALYGSGSSKNLAPWAILRDLYPACSSTRADSIFDLKIPTPLVKKPVLPKVEFFDIADRELSEIRFVLEGGRLIKRHRSSYQYLSEFISEDLAGLEEEFPGCAESFIRQYKAFLKAAKPIPENTKISMAYAADASADKWGSRYNKKMSEHFNNGLDGTFPATVADIRSKSLLYELRSMHADGLLVDMPLKQSQDDLLTA